MLGEMEGDSEGLTLGDSEGLKEGDSADADSSLPAVLNAGSVA